ncbi:carboxylesterase/lipase family protein [Mycolicibacterium confluentis]|uniref:Carboxylic ester hydrolase n=1 Tax=Mycolicibacterium confluentis TaxID=28047 RepID=A0A7I7XVZ9_9MYCO|nr:carboxylesterase/lipase family protein [Mycolicibacterium confluentis]MCV7321639.1 carboxylesterase/lipase family protein [Mycolicibacterium confluentis]ORV31932.1 carboxylesterase [Mycolicibacterium confluentis]BBZ33448.1 carboxylic ester hydrolase [Mycolicibacterium confluentis]
MTGAASPTLTHPVVETRSGPVRGVDDGTVAAWKGIRYAAPPVGDLRWRAPVRPEPWREVLDATAYGSVCPQPDSPIPLGTGTRASEDCLFLNVWSPSQALADQKGRPVMVWVHGGAYIFGAASQPLYDGRALAGEDVVVVTLNYRMGALGFLELGGLGGDGEFDTNVGMRDVLLALEWVRDNIARFGGDPGQVTLFGESAGAGIVTTLLTSPSAAGLFHRAIAQSSPATSAYDSERARSVAALLLDGLGVTASEARSVPIEALVDASQQVFDAVPTTKPGTLAFAPIVDGDLVPDYPVKVARDGRSLSVPLIIGTNRDEASLFRWMKSPLMPIAPKTIRAMFEEIAAEQPELAIPSEAEIGSAYSGIRTRVRGMHVARDVGFRMPTLWFADGHSAVAQVYVYRFDWSTPMLKLLRLGAAHATELPYVFGNLVMGPKDITFKLGGLKIGEAISARMRARWANFARGGEPVGPAGEPWRPYTATDHWALVIDRHDRVVDDPDRDIRAAWGDEVLSFR